MINGVTKEFGEVHFAGARVPAANMIGEPGEGWALAMTVVSHEREPGELGYVARYGKMVNDLGRRVRSDPAAFGSDQIRELGWALVEVEMLRRHVQRRSVRPAQWHRARTARFGRQAVDDMGRTGGRSCRTRHRRRGARGRR